MKSLTNHLVALLFVLAGVLFTCADTIAQNTFPSSGNAGIGTTSPSDPLDVYVNTNGYGPLIGLNNASGGGSAQTVMSFFEGSTYKAKFAVNSSGATSFVGGANAFQIWNFMNSPIVFGTNSIERLRIDSGGNVGIGTTSPSYPLDVVVNSQWIARFKKTDATNGGIIIDAAAAYNPNVALAVNGAVKWYMNNNSANGDTLQFWESTGSVPRFTLSQTGYVGIGNTSPGALLDLKGGNVSYIGQLRLAANDYAQITFYDSANLTPNGTNRKSYIYHDVASGNFNVGSTGNITLSPASIVSVTGNLNVTGTVNAKYQDVAEWVPSSEKLSAGTVVVLDSTKSNQVVASSAAYDTRVAGVISAQPGITLGEKTDDKVLVATTGRVRVMVDATKAPINIGDLLVTSDIPGVAMKSIPVEFAGRKMHMPGTIIGKALEPLTQGKGEILVLLSLQ
ncbi:MAG TPA: hypothetical protein VE969_05945 [Pyrinomonadaceae bacterium]|nr:hypothetical protein [Pyrinomonadaceae bacterium]